MSEVTRILECAQAGDPEAADQLLPLVYDELRRLAAHKMANEVPGETCVRPASPDACIPRKRHVMVAGAKWRPCGHSRVKI